MRCIGAWRIRAKSRLTICGAVMFRGELIAPFAGIKLIALIFEAPHWA
jgi:hypothetical protein